VRVWRLCRAVRAKDPLGGEGGLFVSGRWHHLGTRIVYTSATLSLAALETLVHMKRAMAPPDLVAVEIEIPDFVPVERLTLSKLAGGWDAYPAPASARDMGTNWVAAKRTAILEVPSAIIPRESNYLLNPAHPHLRRIRTVGRAPFSLDPRLLA
jgi:RES domain-containing protein